MTHHLTAIAKRISFLLILAAVATLPAQAQKKMEKKGEIIAEIVSVMKKDNEARKQGDRRLVPVVVSFKVMPATAKLMELEIVLRTTNTDGKSSMVEWRRPLHELTGSSCTLMLPMSEGVFAKDFMVTLRGKAKLADEIMIQATKQGSFPVPNRVVEK